MVVDENVMAVRSLYMNKSGCQDSKMEWRYISEYSLLYGTHAGYLSASYGMKKINKDHENDSLKIFLICTLLVVHVFNMSNVPNSVDGKY